MLIHKTPNGSTLYIDHDLGTPQHDYFKKDLESLITSGERRFTINLKHLDRISNEGLNSLLAFAKKLHQRNGHLVLCDVNPYVISVFLSKGFEILLTEDADFAHSVESPQTKLPWTLYSQTSSTSAPSDSTMT